MCYIYIYHETSLCKPSPKPKQSCPVHRMHRICRMHVWLHGKATSPCSGRHCWILGRIAAAYVSLNISNDACVLRHPHHQLSFVLNNYISIVYIKTIMFYYYICNELITYHTFLSPNFTFGCRQVHTLGQVASLNTEHTLSLNTAGGQQKTLSRFETWLCDAVVRPLVLCIAVKCLLRHKTLQ